MKKGAVGWLGERTASFGGNGHNVTTIDGVSFSEGELLLQALNGFVLVVTAEGYVFYASPTIQDYLGFHQSDVVHQSVFELIHTDDRAMFRRQLHFALNPRQFSSEQGGDGMQNSSDITNNIVSYDPQHIPPENSSFLERSFCCRFRCLLDNSSGFLALNFQGRLKYLHGQNRMSEDGTMTHPQLALFVIAMPVQPPSILEIRTKTLIFQTKHKLDFTPMGIDTRNEEGEEHLRQRKMQLPFNFATGEGVLYDTTPSLDIPEMSGNGKASKMRKMPDQKMLDPNSLLGSILKQDKSVYIQPTESDVQLAFDNAFIDSHALVNVPSDVWQQGSPKSNCRIKEETNVMAMMDSLEQIISNGSLEDLDVDDMELKEWENALLRMNIEDSDMSDEFSNIITNDILSYVEDALFSGNGSEQLNPLGSVPSSSFLANTLTNQNTFLGVPESLQEAELQNSMLPVNQSFSHQSTLLSDPQKQVTVDNPQPNYLGIVGKSLPVTGETVSGFQQLPQVGLQVPMELSGPAQIQPPLQLQPGDMFSQSGGLTEPISKNVLGQNNQLSLNATLAGPCVQNQVRHSLPGAQTMFSPTKLNDFGHLPQKQMQTPSQGMTGTVHPNPMAVPFQNQQQAGLTAQQMNFQEHTSVNQSNQMVSGQVNGWNPSIPNVNFADNLLEACTPNVLAQQDREPAPDTQLYVRRKHSSLHPSIR
ncbi:hypothetical protein JZ751_027855 [Albula glossodonta]|uniref:PAS domain-containing protein n=1 Tax=Albula glossodonta TaxID=121402 RepID=A0A8T2PIG4_9TELE|nr:hypothetical protein JZ751_027855 [Albula glossodonta]